MTISPTIIHFVRHGEVYNPREILYGRMPRFRLSPRGIEQSRAAANYLKGHHIAKIFHSPMLRARQTARVIGMTLKVQPEQSALLNEIYTPYEGKPLSYLDSIDWNLYEGIDPKYEQPEDIIRRIRRFTNRVLRDYHGKEIVAVTHGDIVLHVHLWARDLDPIHENRRSVQPYPAPGSFTTLTFATTSARPTLTYHQP